MTLRIRRALCTFDATEHQKHFLRANVRDWTIAERQVDLVEELAELRERDGG